MQRFTERFFSSGCGGLSIIPQIAFCPVQLPFCPFVLLDNIEQLLLFNVSTTTKHMTCMINTAPPMSVPEGSSARAPTL
jgi:hypothetical protein